LKREDTVEQSISLANAPHPPQALEGTKESDPYPMRSPSETGPISPIGEYETDYVPMKVDASRKRPPWGTVDRTKPPPVKSVIEALESVSQSQRSSTSSSIGLSKGLTDEERAQIRPLSAIQKHLTELGIPEKEWTQPPNLKERPVPSDDKDSTKRYGVVLTEGGKKIFNRVKVLEEALGPSRRTPSLQLERPSREIGWDSVILCSNSKLIYRISRLSKVLM